MITAFKEIRLTNKNVKVENNKLNVGGQDVVYTSETGDFATQNFVATVSGVLNEKLTSNTAGVSSINNATGDLGITGVGNISVTQDGQNFIISGDTSSFATTASLINFSGNTQNFVTLIDTTGFDSYFIAFPGGNFPSTPKVNTTVETTGEITYFCSVRNRTISGFNAEFSDDIAEEGVSLNVIASVNS